MARKPKPNFQPYGNKRSGGQKKGPMEQALSDLLGGSNNRRSKGQDSRKVHDTKGKNKHGRRSW